MDFCMEYKQQQQQQQKKKKKKKKKTRDNSVLRAPGS